MKLKLNRRISRFYFLSILNTKNPKQLQAIKEISGLSIDNCDQQKI